MFSPQIGRCLFNRTPRQENSYDQCNVVEIFLKRFLSHVTAEAAATTEAVDTRTIEAATYQKNTGKCRGMCSQVIECSDSELTGSRLLDTFD